MTNLRCREILPNIDSDTSEFIICTRVLVRMSYNKKRNIITGFSFLLIIILYTHPELSGWISFVFLCELIILMATPRLTVVWAFLKRSKQAKDLSAKRTSETTGTIIGMTPVGVLTSKGSQVYPLAEFEANGDTHYASITCMCVRFKAGDEPAWGKNLTVLIPMSYYNGLFGSAANYQDLRSVQQIISDFQVEELACDDISEWNHMRYEKSIFSKLLPVGMKVRVTYDPEDPTNSEIVPSGEDTPSMTYAMAAFVCHIFVLLWIFYIIWFYAVS